MNSSKDDKITSNKILRSKLILTNYDPSLYLEEYFNVLASISSDSLINTSSSNIPASQSPEIYLRDIFHQLTTDVSEIVNDLDKSIHNVQKETSQADNILIKELENHSKKLISIQNAVESIQNNFEKASSNAMRIGERLTIADDERNRLEIAIEIMLYTNYFEELGSSKKISLDQISSSSIVQIREFLPPSLKYKDISHVSKVLHDLKRILYDINSEEVQNAQVTIIPAHI